MYVVDSALVLLDKLDLVFQGLEIGRRKALTVKKGVDLLDCAFIKYVSVLFLFSVRLDIDSFIGTLSRDRENIHSPFVLPLGFEVLRKTGLNINPSGRARQSPLAVDRRRV